MLKAILSFCDPMKNSRRKEVFDETVQETELCTHMG